MHAAAQPFAAIVSAAIVLLAPLALTGCSDRQEGPGSGTAVPAAPPAAAPTAAESGGPGAAAEEPLPPLAYETALPEAVRAELGQSFKGDLDGMV